MGWFERACLKSLCWPKNKASIQNATWCIFTKVADEPKVRELAGRAGCSHIQIAYIPDSIQGNSPQMGAILLQCLFQMIDLCLKDGSQMLTAPPDTIFSEGTIEAMLRVGAFGHSCVAVPHPRVSPSIFGQIKDQPLSGAELVSLTLKHGHKAWSEAEIGHERQSSFVGGIAWQKIGDKLYAVQHRLPTIYLANFIASDYAFFQKPHDGLNPTYGAWDHVWPSELIKTERQRTIGSSDAAFILEVTKDDLNIPPQAGINPHEPDSFWRSEHHNSINRQFCYIMRSE